MFGVSTMGCIEDAKVNLPCSGAVRWVVFGVSTMGCIEDVKVNLPCSGASRLQIEVQCYLDVREAFRNTLNNCLVTLGSDMKELSFCFSVQGRNSSLIVCWAHCPALCSVMGSIL